MGIRQFGLPGPGDEQKCFENTAATTDLGRRCPGVIQFPLGVPTGTTVPIEWYPLFDVDGGPADSTRERTSRKSAVFAISRGTMDSVIGEFCRQNSDHFLDSPPQHARRRAKRKARPRWC